jgi:uncharacterized protein (DUF305 family)
MKQLLTVSALALTLALSPSAYAANDMSASKTTQAAKAPYDVQFLDTMSEHHRDGIKMMQLAVDKAQSQDIKQMAQKGIDDQNQDIDDMKSLRQSDAPEAVNIKLPGMMSKAKMQQDMAKLEAAAGSDFDKHFLQTMIKHHQGGVKMADDALGKASDADVKSKAKEIHDKQKQEIAQMQDMLKGMK